MRAPCVFGGQADGFFGKASGMSSNLHEFGHFLEGDERPGVLMNLKEKMVMLGILPK